MIYAFLNGISLGLGLVMPLGPLNVFIFNNSSLQTRYLAILPVILVASLCDLSLIFFAVKGVDLLARFPSFKLLIMAAGIIFLLTTGIAMWRMPSRTFEGEVIRRPLSKQLLYSMALSLFNPHAIMDTFIVIGAVSTTYLGIEKHAFTSGCMFSDFAWFLFLGTSGFFLHKMKHGAKIFTFIDKLSAAIMIYLAFQLSFDLIQNLTGGL